MIWEQEIKIFNGLLKGEYTGSKTYMVLNTHSWIRDHFPYSFLHINVMWIMENESTEERNKAVIRRWVDEMYAEARWELVEELAGPLYIRHEPSGTFTVTVEEQMALLKKRYGGREGAQSRESSYELFAEGDKVCMIGTGKGYRIGGGVDDVYNYVQVFRLENGKIVETWFPGFVKNVEW